MMISFIRASYELMDEVRQIINSNYDLYKDIVDPKDLSEHKVDEEWAERNYKIREFYLLRTQGTYVGAASFQKLMVKEGGGEKPYAYIGYFYIKRGFQRRGLGSVLMNFLELRAKQENIPSILLFAQPKAEWAIEFYKKRGFSIFLAEKEPILNFGGGVLQPYYEEKSLLMKKDL